MKYDKSSPIAYSFYATGTVTASGIRPGEQLSLPWSVVMETVGAVTGVVIGDEFLIGGYSRPGLFCGRTYEQTQGGL